VLQKYVKNEAGNVTGVTNQQKHLPDKNLFHKKAIY